MALPPERVSILPPKPQRPKRGRPLGSGMGSRALRAYHREQDEQAREAAAAQALSEAQVPGTIDYARTFKRPKTSRKTREVVQLDQPMSLQLAEPLAACPDGFISSLVEMLTAKDQQKGAGQKLRAVKQFRKVSSKYLSPLHHRTLVGTLVEADRFQLKHATTASGMLTRMGALVYFRNRVHVASVLMGLLGTLLQGDKKPFLLVIMLMSDSTPLPVSHAQKRKGDPATTEPPGGASSSSTALVPRELFAQNKDFRSTTRKHSKILQSEVQYVVTVRDPDPDSTEEFTTYEFTAFCNLQHLDRGTGENTANAWASVLYVYGLGVLRDLFEREGYVIKVNMADRDGANGCADDSWAAETTSVLHLRVPCVLHMLHTVCGVVMMMFNMLLSGIIAFQLTMNQGHANEQFFECLVGVLVSSADLHIDTAPPPANAPHRVQQGLLLDKLLHECEVDRRRAYILKCNLVGVFSELRIPVYATSAEAEAGSSRESQQAYIKAWAHETASALYVNTRPMNRGRWLLNCKPVSEKALCACVHNLGERTFDIYMAKHKPLTKSKAGDNTSQSSSQLVAGGFPIPAFQKPVKGSQGQDGQPSGQSAGGGGDADDDTEAENRRLRGDALVFWKSRPGAKLLILTTCLLYLTQLFRKLLKMSSLEWDRKRHKNETDGKPRRYRLYEAASGRWTEQFFKAANDLMWDSTQWIHLPPEYTTEKSQTYAYAILAKLMAGVRHHVGIFMLFPFSIWRLLCSDPAERLYIADQLLKTPKCMVDSKFGLWFLTIFCSVPMLCSTPCVCILLVVAIITRCDTSRVECRHAAIRQILLAKSTTWAAHIGHLSANFMCTLARRSAFVKKDKPGPAEGDECEEETSESAWFGGGGPARYFVRLWLSGRVSSPEDREAGDQSTAARRRSFTRMWEAYRRIKAEGGRMWQDLVRQGELGSHASAAGDAAFGPKPSRTPQQQAPRIFRPGDAAAPTCHAIVLSDVPTRQERVRTLKEMTDSARLAAAKERDQANAENEAAQAWSIAAVASAWISSVWCFRHPSGFGPAKAALVSMLDTD